MREHWVAIDLHYSEGGRMPRRDLGHEDEGQRRDHEEAPAAGKRGRQLQLLLRQESRTDRQRLEEEARVLGGDGGIGAAGVPRPRDRPPSKQWLKLEFF